MGLLSGAFTRRGVRFVRLHREERPLPDSDRCGTFTFEIYTARTARKARDFLNSKTVTEPLHRIVVDTPEGTWGKGIEGMYKD